MPLAVLLFCAAGALAWLSIGDRMSVPALTVVEWESAVGVPLWEIVALAGLVVLAISRRPRRREAAPERVVNRDAQRSFRAGPAAPEGGDWRATLDARARRLALEPHGKVKVDEVGGVPYTLVLRAVTPQQARRRFGAFVEFLAAMPTPPLARVRIESSPDLGVPVNVMLSTELARCFGDDAFHVVSRADGADVCFRRPDPRWGASSTEG